MFFGLSWSELLVIGVVAMVIVGPTKLPHVAAQGARYLREIRQLIDSARADVVRSAGIDESTLSSLADLHPKRLAATFLSTDALLGEDATTSPGMGMNTRPRVNPTVTSSPRQAGGLDPDAT